MWAEMPQVEENSHRRELVEISISFNRWNDVDGQVFLMER